MSKETGSQAAVGSVPTQARSKNHEVPITAEGLAAIQRHRNVHKRAAEGARLYVGRAEVCQ